MCAGVPRRVFATPHYRARRLRGDNAGLRARGGAAAMGANTVSNWHPAAGVSWKMSGTWSTQRAHGRNRVRRRRCLRG